MLRNRIQTFLNRRGAKLEYDGWQVHIFENEADNIQTLRSRFNEIWQHLSEPAEILKQDHRSFVATFEFEEKSLVIKKFTLQSNWFWFRWTSTIFASLGEIACRNSFLMKEDGLLIPEPMMLWQKINNLMVIESWMVYKYLDGELLNPSDVKNIVTYVKSMHMAGWVHRDPHAANFLKTSDGISTLDPIRAVKSNSKYLRACDVLHMSRDMPNAAYLYGMKELGIWFSIARKAHLFTRFYRLLKYRLQAISGYNPHKSVPVNITNDTLPKK